MHKKFKMAAEASMMKRRKNGGVRYCFKGRKSVIFCCFGIFLMFYIAMNLYHFKTVTNFELDEFITKIEDYKNTTASFSLAAFTDFRNVLISLKANFYTKYVRNTRVSQTPVSHLVRKSHDTGMFLHNDKGQLLCGTTTLKVLILIVSNHNDLDLRMAIRKTWANKAAMTAKYIKHGRLATEFKWRKLFVISRGDSDWAGARFVQTELLMQPDILDVEIQEHPTKQAMKLYSALRWALNNCNFQYLMYTTAQNFINLPELYNFFHPSPMMENSDLYAGNLVDETIFLPNMTNREKNEFMKMRLQFIEGESSILSRPLLEAVIDDLAYISTFYGSIKSDIMVATAMHKHKVKATNIKNFIKRLDCPDKCCDNSKEFIQVHETNPNCFRTLIRNYN